MCFVWFNQPNIINANHKGRLKVKVRAMCLEAVKIYGNNPIKLFIKIKTNSAMKGIALPIDDKGPNKVLNSLNNFKIIFDVFK